MLARHEDIAPTVLGRVGLAVPEDLPGRDLVEAARREGRADAAAAFGHFESRGPHYELGWAEIRGVRTRRWKFTAAPQPQELYDVLADPRELDNRADDEPVFEPGTDHEVGGVEDARITRDGDDFLVTYAAVTVVPGPAYEETDFFNRARQDPFIPRPGIPPMGPSYTCLLKPDSFLAGYAAAGLLHHNWCVYALCDLTHLFQNSTVMSLPTDLDSLLQRVHVNS